MKSQHFEIEIVQQGKEAFPKQMPKLKVGDTVRYFSNAGSVTISFPNLTPYEKDGLPKKIVANKETVTVSTSKGPFQSGCTIKLHSGEIIGWDSKAPLTTSKSGAEFPVGD